MSDTTAAAAQSQQTEVRVSGLSKQFGEVQALEDISLSLAHNEFVSVVGASGCGKSTLLSIIAGLSEPTSGDVLINGEEITGPGRDRGVVFQGFTLFPWLTAQGNVEFALREEPMNKRERAEVARQHLALVGLDGFEAHFPSQLSGGMQQRVSIARSLAYRPRILLMDEPFGALDALTRREMQGLLTQIWEQHRLTVMMITHDIDEAIITADKVVVMSRRPGRIRAELPVPLERPRKPEMASLPEFRDLFTTILHMVHEQDDPSRTAGLDA